jgi:WD40 repeat protein
VTCLASAGNRGLLSGGADGIVRYWDVVDGACQHLFAEHSDWITAIAASDDGTMAISTGWDGTVCVWNLERATLLNRFGSGGVEIRTLALSRDKRLAITGDSTGVLCLWDVLTGFRRQRTEAHRGGVNALAFGPSSRGDAVSAGDDGLLILWACGRCTGGHAVWTPWAHPYGGFHRGWSAGRVGWCRSYDPLLGSRHATLLAHL